MELNRRILRGSKDPGLLACQPLAKWRGVLDGGIVFRLLELVWCGGHRPGSTFLRYRDRPNNLPDLHCRFRGSILIPGPAVVFVLARRISGGQRVGIAPGFGVAFGNLVHTLMATLGLSAILMTSALTFEIVKYAGVAYLVYLGIRRMRLTAAKT
ncbi:LysE family translocator [Rhizobium sp. XQZ8]|uniref:LysE family translocator n=1 Tax=Rhizobium populisoli TaxID=2859785 RepID=UPI001C66269F|nr:LysE family translocator [Rhizobium populisoli]MBW6425101.1 LysE family translocator [Rhizobium populisoli]